MNEQQRGWALAGARQAIIDALSSFPELGVEFGVTKITAETLKAKVDRTFTTQRTAKRNMSAAARKRISDAAKKRWVEWRKKNARKG